MILVPRPIGEIGRGIHHKVPIDDEKFLMHRFGGNTHLGPELFQLVDVFESPLLMAFIEN